MFQGVNIDPRYDLPFYERTTEIEMVRFPFYAQKPRGFDSLDAAIQFYTDIVERYKNQKILIILGHQTYGEMYAPGTDSGRFDWNQMARDPYHADWNEVISGLADYAEKIARYFKGKVYAYQIWNEQDTPIEHARAAVPVPAQTYARMVKDVSAAIKRGDEKALVVLGGLVRGAVAGEQYLRFCRLGWQKADQDRIDGVGIHLYGMTPPNFTDRELNVFGALGQEQTVLYPLLRKPLWVTEFGLLDWGSRMEEGRAANYARSMLRYFASLPNIYASAIWYGWSDQMDNGYGLVGSGNIRNLLYNSIKDRVMTTFPTVSEFPDRITVAPKNALTNVRPVPSAVGNNPVDVLSTRREATANLSALYYNETDRADWIPLRYTNDRGVTITGWVHSGFVAYQRINTQLLSPQEIATLRSAIPILQRLIGG